uniref:Peptidoglycan D,D-transpeptidase FtsI homolog n=1 Tax=Mesostigma viride TaxID=41882 RepID=FTSIH_MESVI|nr:peptidoglycan synthetase [Mesostigma viride]Q9MUV9.1 RecName: Full=Peptidoglycan D,D-transpeptidase FtsI homolog [Mesostigma viride]AAF43792.1 putative peptidoglycan synthetase [Mesostigma viride]WKT08202.1 penicillin-binding protein [Mesostigma viride]
MNKKKIFGFSRIVLVWILFFSGSSLLLGRLFYLQVMKGSWLTNKAKNQQTIILNTFQPRRTICDRNGIPLAIDTLAYDIFAHPLHFKKSTFDIANELYSILNLDVEYLQNLFIKNTTGICIAHQAPEQIANQIIAKNIEGIELVQHPKRYYPYKQLCADVIGYVNTLHEGQAGLELSCQESLQLQSPEVVSAIDGRGFLINDGIPRELFKQDSLCLQLTIDLDLQKASYLAIYDGIKKCNAKRGTVIILDPYTGAILALVTAPSYDPNVYYDFPIERFKNWPVIDLYEPGSTFKPINMAIALEAKAIKKNDFFYDEGCIQISDTIITNNNYYNKQFACDKNSHLNITDVLSNSSNVGMVHILQRLAPEIYYQWIQKLGLGNNVFLETDFPLSSYSSLKNILEFTSYNIESAVTSFGQGLAMTPIKLAQLYACLSNGGNIIRPYIVDGLFDIQNEKLFTLNNNIFDQNISLKRKLLKTKVFSPSTTEIVLDMLEEVIFNGTGSSCFLPGYRIGGKTGTSQKHAEQGGYSTKHILTSFAAIFPINNPQYVILSVIDEPSIPLSFGSNTAGPVVRSIIESLIRIKKIPPSIPTLTHHYYCK